MARRAAEQPDAVAVEAGAELLTYAQLLDAARRIAAGLRAAGVGPEEPLAVCLPRSPQAVCAFLGILLSGAAYVPLGTAQPRARAERMLRRAGVVRALTAAEHGVALPDGVEILDLETLAASPAAEPPPPGGDRLAYVLFTSGSTGEPKGVEITDANLTHVLGRRTALLPLREDTVLAVAPVEFDISAWEIWAALTVGARLLLLPPGRPDPREIGQLAAERGATYTFFAAGLFEQVVRAALPDLAGMRLIAAGGDVMAPAAAAALREAHPHVRLLNAYGPTETSIVACFHEVGEVDDGPLPIGAALPGYELHVLDPDGHPVAPGEPGELWIGGPGVGRGYRGDPERTAERFRPDRFSGVPGARIYATGDIVRLPDDGELRFVGRADDQVKISGHRIEPGEVEQALGAHPGVRHAAVVAREDVVGHKRLVGYATLREGSAADPAELREHLAGRLPRYMLPAEVEILPELPLTARGKIDRAALPSPRGRGGPQASGGAADAIGEIAAEVLGLDRVGPDDDFFALGADSLLALQIVGRLRDRFAIGLDINAIFDAPTARELARRVDAAEPAAPLPLLRRIEGDDPPPAGFAQRRAWLFEQINPGSLAYQFACLIDLDGPLDERALAAALGDLIDRHEILRTALVEGDGELVQIVEDAVPLPLETVDLRGEDRSSWSRLVHERVRTRIDLARAPLLRWTLVRRGEDRWTLIDVEHHAVHDGLSFMIVLAELAELYSARAEGRAAELPPARLQFGDFARWERAALDPDRERRQLDYWRRTLDPDPPLLELPAARARPARESFQGGSVRRRFDPALATQVRRLAAEERSTSFMACLAAYATLLARLGGEQRVQIGSGLAGRSDPAAERLVGMMVATIALRIDLSGDPTVRELLRRVRGVVLDGVANSDVPFDRVVEALAPPRRPDRPPLAQTLFSFDDAPAEPRRWAGLDARVVQTIPNGTAKAELNVIGVDHGDGEPFFIWEHSDLYSDAEADRLAGHHLRLLEQFVEQPDARLSELGLLAPEERREIARASVNDDRYDRAATVPSLIAAAAERDPDATAAIDGARRLSYRELRASAAAVSAALRELGVRPGDRVGVLLGRSADAIAAQLGILSTGAAYVSLDPQHPPERLSRILLDAGAAAVVSNATLAGRIPLPFPLLDIAAATGGEPPGGLIAGPEDLAYLVYTSGSTGEPKGVEVTHRNIARLVDDPRYAELGPGTAMLHAASPAFDAATLEVWGPLANGGAVICLSEHPSPDAIATAIAQHGVTSAWLTAGLFHQVVDRRPGCLGGLRQLLCGGDVLSPDHVRRALAALPAGARLTNGYGPTETTTFATTYDLRPGDPVDGPIPIGRPIQATSCNVVDAAGNELPSGAPGELAIGGDGVARGYRGDPELTAARFRADPDRPGGRRYLTGDRVRRRADGALEFLGRIDRQLKLRGVRVEPAEIEQTLRSHPAVADAAVVPFERAPGELALAAYLVAEPGTAAPDAVALRAHVLARLPAAMAPTAWVLLAELPLTANGKLDRERLPAPGRGHLAAGNDERPAAQGEGERRVIECFERVLGVRPVGAEDDFFALGGHSLLAVSLFDELEQIAGRRLSLATIFEAPTPRQLAAQLGPAAKPPSWENLVALKPGGSRPPLFAIAAGDGNVVGFGPLARRLSAEQPLYALQPSGLDGRQPLDGGIEAMASRYLQALRAVRPHGPYLLVGRCNGARVAYEMAQQLRADGEQLPLLAILDSDPPQARPFELAPGIPYDLIMEVATLRARQRGELTPDPCSPAGRAQLAEWLGKPLAGGVTRYLAEAWSWREDLREAWPDPLGEDAAALAEWGWDHGRRELLLAAPLLTPQPLRGEPRAENLRRIRAQASSLTRSAATSLRSGAADVAERRLGRTLPQARRRTERRVVAAARRAAEGYRADPWPGPIVLVTSTEYSGKPQYLAWAARAQGGLDLEPLPLGHIEMLREPGAALLAARLEQRIAAALDRPRAAA